MISEFGEEYLPKRATEHSAGYDFYSPRNIRDVSPVNIKTGEYYLVDTGIRLEDGDLADDEVMLIVPRSSLGFKYGFYLSNTVGVIDSDYRDTIKLAFNIEKDLFDIKKGDRIAQGIIVKYGTLGAAAGLDREVKPTRKRRGGLGSTGE